MPDEKRSSNGKGDRRTKAEDRATAARLKAEHDVGILDNPDVPGEPGEIRHLLYFAGVLGLGIGLNLLAMLMVAGAFASVLLFGKVHLNRLIGLFRRPRRNEAPAGDERGA